MYDNEWKEKFLDENKDNYQDKQKLEKILDDFVSKGDFLNGLPFLLSNLKI